MKKPKLKFNHGEKFYHFTKSGLKKMFPGSKFIGEIAYKGLDVPVAIFHQPKPDLSKNHKEYFGLFKFKDSYHIIGFDKKDMLKHAIHDAVHCLKCGDVIYSRWVHDFRSCKCRKTNIDGGKEYTKIGGDADNYKLVKADILNEVILDYTKLNKIING